MTKIGELSKHYILDCSNLWIKTNNIKFIMRKIKTGKPLSECENESLNRYLDEIGTINNSEARQLLKLTDNDVSYISKLFKEMLNSGDIEIDSTIGNNKNIYRRKQ